MGRQDEVVKERLKKITELKKQGINPYISKFPAENTNKDLQTRYSNLKKGEETKDSASICGRLIAFRDLGKIAFGVVDDGTGKIQVTLQEKETSSQITEFVKKYIDIGDFIGVKGRIFRTQRGELSILIKDCKIATKSIFPFPEQWYGIQNTEERLRKRYLDILLNPEVKEIFIRKSKFWQTMREFLQSRGFLEVETPILENSAGGASATPFITHHNALDLEVYLRISMGELWQKKLMVAGYPKTFEIGRQFRNEGMDSEHLQDYTQMEFYWGYANFEDGMELVEEMYRTLAEKVFNKTKFTVGEHTFDLGKPWKTIDYTDTIKKETGINVFEASRQDIEKNLDKLNQEYSKGADKSRLIDSLWKYCRKRITGPVFLTGQIVEVSPLAKRSSKDPRKVEQFQIILAGSELGNGYSELNDPIDQESRFEEQHKMKEAGDKEAQPHDKDFVEALRYGMPPTCGFGVSERLFAFLEGKPIRETVIFPLMKPEHVEEGKKENLQNNDGGENGSRGNMHPDLPKTIPKGKSIGRAEALSLLKEYVKSESLQQHCLAVEKVMRAYANYFKEDEEQWSICGLLHDFDYEKYPEKHTIEGTSILIEKKYPKEIIHAILSHYSSFTGVPRDSLLDKVLFAVDELTGLITALSKVRSGGFEGMTSESVEKALKKKDFAAKVDRKDIELGIQELSKLGVSRAAHFNLIIESLKKDKRR